MNSHTLMMKMMNSENCELWSLPMAEALEQLFAYAEANRVEGVSINVRTRDIKLSFASESQDEESSDNVSFYQLMKEKYLDEEPAKREYKSWLVSMIQTPKAQHFQQYIGGGLESLLKGDFLIEDKFITDDERLDAQNVLTNVSVKADGYVDKCVVLLRMVGWADNRFVFDSEEHIGKYMKQHSEILTRKDFRSFFDFVAHCNTVYTEQDNLEISELKSKVDVCVERAMKDIAPLANRISEGIDESSYHLLWQYIIYNKVSLAQKMLNIEPNRFEGGYNKKLVCNIIGLMIDGGVYDLNKNQANDLIYTTNVKSYISNYADNGTDSCLTREERKWIEAIIRENKPQ